MKRNSQRPPSPDEIAEFEKLLDLYRYDFDKLVYILFGFGESEDMPDHPHEWQLQEWRKLSVHLKNPRTRYQTYRLIISTGNGSGKTAFEAMTMLMLLYTQRLHARLTANTQPQLQQIIWPEYDIWCNRALYFDWFFEKQGTSIKAKNPELAEKWRIDWFTWDVSNPTATSGLHNKYGAVAYVFEEAPGIPYVIWKYARGAFIDEETIKLWIAVGNSDDPNSQFEQNMTSPEWNAVRIDTRSLPYTDKAEIASILRECGGDEDADDFRVRVRGLPRKSAKDSIIKVEAVEAAVSKGYKFDPSSVSIFPVVLMCDPAWTGGDEVSIWMHQGPHRRLLERYRLSKINNETHQKTYDLLCHWERIYNADLVVIDQGEGTTLYTLAQNAGKMWWRLVAFGSNPNDKVDPKESEYANIRAQMYYETKKWLDNGGIITSRDPAWTADIIKQLTWAKEARHKRTGKKLVQSKDEIKEEYGHSPDLADGCVLGSAYLSVDKRYHDGDDEANGEGTEMEDIPMPYDT